jgi:transcriptional regulator with XRE-family HTH domain
MDSTLFPNQRMRQLRLERGWTVEDLASRAGVSARTVYSIESRAHRPRRATARVLGIALGCDADDLVDGAARVP